MAAKDTNTTEREREIARATGRALNFISRGDRDAYATERARIRKLKREGTA